MERIITKSFARLMGRGVHRGFITYEELNKSLGKRNLSNENLEQAFIHILNEKILELQNSIQNQKDSFGFQLKQNVKRKRKVKRG